jgi:hypothetical protein
VINHVSLLIKIMQSGFALIAQRCFADGPLAAAKPVDWNAIYSAGFKDEEKKELAAFRNTLTEVQERLSQLSKVTSPLHHFPSLSISPFSSSLFLNLTSPIHPHITTTTAC